MSSLLAIIGKDLKLLLRDRAALVFIVIAPVVVICVAGFSLASLYGADPTGQIAYELPIVDEDGGDLAAEIEQRLAANPSVHVRRVATRAEAERLVLNKISGSALVIPAGTAADLAAGKAARIVLYTDPVKYLERLNVRLELLQARDELAEAGRANAVALLAAQRSRLAEQLHALDAALMQGRADLEALQRTAHDARATTVKALAAETARVQADVMRQINVQIDALVAQVDDTIAARVDTLRAPAHAYLDALQDARAKFEVWFADLQRLAARRADEIPPPPAFPEPPPELLRALNEPPAPLRLPAGLGVRIDLPVPALPDLPTVTLDLRAPALDVTEPVIPSVTLTVEEVTVSGAPVAINTFDQNVPGFSVTFLLLGMLLGVSLGLLDERDWGTFDRVRAQPVPTRHILVGKLASRFAVGVVQMLLLFAVGYALFGISLGPQPWALALPIVGIVFAGTAFGLIVAVGARSRDSVLPLGSVAIVTMAAIGGCWWPIDLEPHWMRTIALAFPTTWAMEAFNDLMIRKRDATAAYLPTAMLIGYGLLYLGLGVLLFRRRIVRDDR